MGKYSHKYSDKEKQKFLATALELGDSASTTRELRRRFNLSEPAAYYYRRKAHGYYRGKRLPVNISVSAEAADLLSEQVAAGHASSRGEAAEKAIVKVYGEGQVTMK